MNNISVVIFAVDHCNTLGLLHSLRDVGIVPTIILVANEQAPYLLPSSNSKCNLIIVNTIDDGYQELLKLRTPEYKSVVLTGMDAIEFCIDEHYDELQEYYYVFNVGKQGGVSYLMNKAKQKEIAESCGISVIKSEVVKRGQLPHTLKYPIMTKALDSTNLHWKRLVHICDNETELLDVYKNMCVDYILLEEYIDKSNEIAVSGYSINRGEVVDIPLYMSYYRFTKSRYGTYFFIDEFRDENLKNKIIQFIQKVKYEGIFESEFIVDKHNNIYYLETNFRASIWVHGFTDYGFNIPYLYINALLKKSNINNQLRIREKPFVGILEPADFLDHVIKGKVGFFKWLKQCRHADTYFYYDKLDKKPFYKMILRNINPIRFFSRIK